VGGGVSTRRRTAWPRPRPSEAAAPPNRAPPRTPCPRLPSLLPPHLGHRVTPVLGVARPLFVGGLHRQPAQRAGGRRRGARGAQGRAGAGGAGRVDREPGSQHVAWCEGRDGGGGGRRGRRGGSEGASFFSSPHPAPRFYLSHRPAPRFGGTGTAPLHTHAHTHLPQRRPRPFPGGWCPASFYRLCFSPRCTSPPPCRPTRRRRCVAGACDWGWGRGEGGRTGAGGTPPAPKPKRARPSSPLATPSAPLLLQSTRRPDGQTECAGGSGRGGGRARALAPPPLLAFPQSRRRRGKKNCPLAPLPPWARPLRQHAES
jgi:hypothetical protein